MIAVGQLLQQPTMSQVPSASTLGLAAFQDLAHARTRTLVMVLGYCAMMNGRTDYESFMEPLREQAGNAAPLGLFRL